MKLLARKKHKSNGTVWKVVGGVALAVVTAGLIANLHDIKRLIHMHTM
jgi:hypothetical protein